MLGLSQSYLGVALGDEVVQLKLEGYHVDPEIIRAALDAVSGLANRVWRSRQAMSRR